MPPWVRRRREGAILLIHRDPGRFEHFVTLGEPSAEPPWPNVHEAGGGAANVWHGGGDYGYGGYDGYDGYDGGDGDDFGPELLAGGEERRGPQEIGPEGDDLEARLEGLGLPRYLPSSASLRLPRRGGPRSSLQRHGLGLGADRQQAAPPEPELSEEARREARRLQRQPIHVIGRAMYETSGIPPDWADKCNEWVDEVPLPPPRSACMLQPHAARLQPHAARLQPHAPTGCTCSLRPTTHYSLLTTHYSQLTTHHSPLTTHHSLLTPHSSLLTPHLLTTHY